jgi:hypothetical protein
MVAGLPLLWVFWLASLQMVYVTDACAVKVHLSLQLIKVSFHQTVMQLTFTAC